MKPADVGLFARTLRHVPLSQILHRVRLRAQKHAYRLAPALTSRAFSAEVDEAPGWLADFTPVDAVTEAEGRPSLADNVRGQFELLDESHDLGVPIEWQPAGASQLWRYHLHYFDWAWVLLAEGPGDVANFCELYRSWRDANPVGRWDAWSPYVVALRSWTLCSISSVVAADPVLKSELDDDLARHARYLRSNAEFDVGGNHLIKNLKALIGLGVYLGDDRLLMFGARHLADQVDVQVLSDGGHFELSPGYHAQVLADFIDIHRLLESAGMLPGLVAQVAAAIGQMQGWLSTLLRADRSLPAFGDTVPVAPSRLAALGVSEASTRAFQSLQPSGYVVARPREGVSLVVDVGPPCPDELPAHAQADALSLLLHADGQEILLDTGTSTYGSGPRRQYERSTRAHNTVEIDGEDTTEVWGAFRAGRRHRVTLHEASGDGASSRIDASHDGYRHLDGSPIHRRTVTVNPETIDIADTITGGGVHDVVVRWHLGPDATWDADSRTAAIGPARLSLHSSPEAIVTFVAPGDEPLGLIGLRHNVLVGAPCLVVSFPGVQLPLTIHTRIDF